MASSYPTIRKVENNIGRWESEEQVDGVPDFQISRGSLGHVLLKIRTTGQTEVFKTVGEAKAYIAKEFGGK